jgi:hypothetical protein
VLSNGQNDSNAEKSVSAESTVATAITGPKSIAVLSNGQNDFNAKEDLPADRTLAAAMPGHKEVRAVATKVANEGGGHLVADALREVEFMTETVCLDNFIAGCCEAQNFVGAKAADDMGVAQSFTVGCKVCVCVLCISRAHACGRHFHFERERCK